MCTVLVQSIKKENEGTVNAFLTAHPEMEAIQLESLPTKLAEKQANGMLQVFPQDFGSDGFFVAAFRKKRRIQLMVDQEKFNERINDLVDEAEEKPVRRAKKRKA